jgi:signal transduction histidine kinase
MFRLPIRIKLMVGLGLVVGMMLILMGGSMFGLRSFHKSNLMLMDQLPELGAATDLLQAVMRLEQPSSRDFMPGRPDRLAGRVLDARAALSKYYQALLKNSTRGNRIDDGRDEYSLVFLIDDDLTAILRYLEPGEAVEPLFDRTALYLSRHPQLNLGSGPWEGNALLRARLERLNESAGRLPARLHQDMLALLEASKRQYQSSRVIVWTSAVAVLGMLLWLTRLTRRWVLYPVRLLQRGVRRVARGQFDYHIDLDTGDEMQALAEAFNDMTNRLSATYHDLERQIQDRSKQLVRSERLASVGFLAAGVAHEINNPLAAIAFSSEAMEGRLSRLLPADEASPDAKVVRNYARMIQEEAYRCKGITERLLDFSRCNDIQRQRTDLNELVAGVVEMLAHMGKYRGKHVAFAPREPVFAHADPQEIKQVVLNLIVNALESLDAGGTLRIETRRVEGMAEMVFQDNGCGMPPDVLENIFEPFFTRRRGGKGTGLGLSITHRIISQHQGEIAATSGGEGQGSTFAVRLPIRPPEGDAGGDDRERSRPRELAGV